MRRGSQVRFSYTSAHSQTTSCARASLRCLRVCARARALACARGKCAPCACGCACWRGRERARICACARADRCAGMHTRGCKHAATRTRAPRAHEVLEFVRAVWARGAVESMRSQCDKSISILDHIMWLPATLASTPAPQRRSPHPLQRARGQPHRRCSQHRPWQRHRRRYIAPPR